MFGNADWKILRSVMLPGISCSFLRLVILFSRNISLLQIPAEKAK